MKRYVLAMVFAAVLGVSAIGAGPVANAVPVSGSATSATTTTVHPNGWIGVICSWQPAWC